MKRTPKKKKSIKWFPGYDLHITALIIISVGALLIMQACNG